MLRGFYFYGNAGAALTFFDPVTGTTITSIPTIGDKEVVILRGAFVVTSTPATRNFTNIKIGSEGDYHDIQLLPKADGDNMTADLADIDLVPLGDVEVKENSALSGTAPAGGPCAGMILYEDQEPEIPFPEGRHVFLTSLSSADLATTFAVTGIVQPNVTKALSVDSDYYVYAAQTMPEDSLVQAFVLASADGQVAMAPAKGRIVYPSCPMKFNGSQKLAAKGQVLAVTEASVIWELIEVPKGTPSRSSGTQVKGGLTTGGSLKSGVEFKGGFGLSLGSFR